MTTNHKIDKKLLDKLYASLDQKSAEDCLVRFRKRAHKLDEILKQEQIPDHLSNLDRTDALLRISIPAAIEAPLNIGIHDAFYENNPKLLNDALYTYNRLSFYHHRLLSSGTDHCIYFNQVMESYAGNDLDLVLKMFPKDVGLTKKGHKFSVTCANLLISLIHQDPKWLDESTGKAEKYLTQKMGKFDRSLIRYLLALIQKDTQTISNELAEICTGYKRATWIHEFHNPFLKILGLVPHGLYNLAFHTLPQKTFNEIQQPNHPVFWKSLAAYQREIDFRPGEKFIYFDGELDGLNRIYQ
ncbi:hypothetical protein FKX85_10075 [Echinicola soli]|uniref:Uncharacterized protein n=1 Tax=Echinicola soli TaxID=2591634 RepID=A0A514CHR0_9BACT|nr:hypothetical protein [Echinicola soli]QDH79363.1 hypothetical protein FKX85_10075 [Echinicola soli]